ncbi:uncharacterized protein Dvir_GJ18703 [Drosophila virilis]|uniref:Phosphorylase b kinase regulatory subunit n=1 Tax=Drosophila virilis TaxID=7244 RepID=B4M282_DROVI|nr:uncharacterized protein Dvir_GJ18703 [Drosophila virilis]
MRSRSNSGVRLDYYQRIVHRLILAHQEPVTGLFPASNVNSHAWIRDNVYCILAVWGLSMAYKKIADQDEDRAKCYELEQSCVKLMRGLLMAMMNQKDKVEKFKMTQSPYDSLHAKYSSKTGLPVVGDNEWGHLQIDAVSLYLLILAQMTASGLQIVFSLDEVSFLQNLVFYIESAYSIPDYGIWERGDKTNHGEPELNASSIGMAKAALEAMNELDLFGARGGPASVIHVLADEAHKCQAVLQSMLPRESNSKELDSFVLNQQQQQQQLLLLLLQQQIQHTQHIDYEEYYTTRDPDLLASNFTTNLGFLTNNWRHMLGRPTITLMATHYMLDQDKIPLAMIQTMRKLKSGYINGTRVMLGNLKDFLNTSAITDLSFLGSTEDGYPDRLHPDVQTYLDEHLLRSFSNRSTMNLRGGQLRPRHLRRRMSCKGAIKKTRSINVDSDNLGMEGPTPLTERRLSSIVPPPWLQANKQGHVSVFATTPEEGPSSPPQLGGDLGLRENIYPMDPQHSRSAIDRRSEFVRQQEITVPKILIQRHRPDTNFADTEVEELIAMLRETENLEEQGDILQYLVDTQGLDFNTAGLGLKHKTDDNAADLELDDVMLELSTAGGGGGAAGAGAGAGDGDGAKLPVPVVVPTVIIDATSPTASSGAKKDEDNANTAIVSVAAVTAAAAAGSNNSSSSSNNNNNNNSLNNNDSSQSEGMLEEGRVVTVRDLLKGLYEKACQQKLWGLVRHTAGMLGKRVEDLGKAVTDLLVRQKQVTVGMPPNNEHTITAPLPEVELRQLIHDAYGDDESTAMLTQELMVYLAMFIRTEPQLFHEMLRLRVGLIIQVMAKELSRTLNCGGEAASEHLLNLSPFEMKNLLYHILSGKEFAVSSVARGNLSIVSCKSSRVSKKSQIGLGDPEGEDALIATIDDRQGQWLRRRRLDGALNRVPRDFYSRVWTVLEKCQGLAIEGRVLQQSLTQEMTPGELKFALEVETALNQIPQPEYRQLVVEALMVLTLVTEHNMVPSLGGIIYVEHLVHKANQLFLEDQRKVQGDATLCCAKLKDGKEQQQAASGMLLCGGAAYICQHLYDSAPSGSYGTMTYLSRAVALVLDCVPKHGEMECAIS